jgi:hypothetical protein
MVQLRQTLSVDISRKWEVKEGGLRADAGARELYILGFLKQNLS